MHHSVYDISCRPRASIRTRCFKHFVSAPGLLFSSARNRKNSIWASFVFLFVFLFVCFFFFLIAFISVRTHPNNRTISFGVATSHKTHEHAWARVCVCSRRLNQDQHACVFWGGKENLALLVIRRGGKRRWLPKMNLGIKSMRGSKWKATPNPFLHLWLDHPGPLFSCRLMEIEGPGRGKAG